MVPCELWDAQTPTRRPHRLVLRFRCEVELDARRGGRYRADSARGSAVTVTTSAEVVGSSIGRLSHHLMMSDNVCDGLELVRRPNNGRDITDSPIRSFEPRIRGVNGIVHSSTVPHFHDARGSIHVFMTHINTLDT